MAILAVDLGGSSVKYGIIEGDSIEKKGSFLTPNTWEQLMVSLQTVIAEAHHSCLTGIAISSPGVVNFQQRVIEGVSAIEYIHGRPIFEELERTFGLPVAIENDGNCAGLAEVTCGIAKGRNEVVMVVIGTGIGGAVFRDGRLQRGAHLFGGEFGYTFFKENQTLSNLGSPVKMARRYCEKRNVPTNQYSAIDVFDFASSGDSVAQVEVEVFYEYLAYGLFNIQLMLDPEVIIIGGGVSEKKGFIEELNKRVMALFKVSKIQKFTPEIISSKFNNDANLIGAVENFKVVYGNQ